MEVENVKNKNNCRKEKVALDHKKRKLTKETLLHSNRRVCPVLKKKTEIMTVFHYCNLMKA